METRARYALIGAFVLACIFGGFGFVYWLKNVGGIGARAFYQIRFNEPISGLTTGSSVLFNGLRVGAITDISLDPNDPKRVVISIAIDPTTPVRADTQVEVSFQGLTSAPALALKGGKSDAPRLNSPDGKPPVLIAGAGVSQNLSDSARETLKRIDVLIDENAKPLNTAITGFSTFADMLARNSERIESVLGGLEKLTGGGQKQPQAVFDLTAATSFPPIDKTMSAPVTIADPSTTLVFDTQKILIRSPKGTYENVEDGQWADNLPKLVQAKVLQSFENANQLREVSRPNDQPTEGYRLEIGIRNFQIVPEPAPPTALVELSARLTSDKGVAAARMFKASAPAKGVQAADAVAALNEAFTKVAAELVVWTVKTVPKPEPPAMPAFPTDKELRQPKRR